MITRPDIPAGVHDLTVEQSDYLARLVALWFMEHAEMDRAQFLKLLDEAKAVAR